MQILATIVISYLIVGLLWTSYVHITGRKDIHKHTAEMANELGAPFSHIVVIVFIIGIVLWLPVRIWNSTGGKGK